MGITITSGHDLTDSEMSKALEDFAEDIEHDRETGGDGSVTFVSHSHLKPNKPKLRGPGYTRPAPGTRGKHGKRRGC